MTEEEKMRLEGELLSYKWNFDFLLDVLEDAKIPCRQKLLEKLQKQEEKVIKETMGQSATPQKVAASLIRSFWIPKLSRNK